MEVVIVTDKKLKHHHLAGSPFCFKIKPLLDHLGYDYEVRVWHFHQLNEYKKINTLNGLWPMIEMADGTKVVESDDIYNYLLGKEGNLALINPTEKIRALSKLLEKKIGNFLHFRMALTIQSKQYRKKARSMMYSEAVNKSFIKRSIMNIKMTKMTKRKLKMLNKNLVGKDVEALMDYLDNLLATFDEIIGSDPNNPFLLETLSRADFYLIGHLNGMRELWPDLIEKKLNQHANLKEYAKMFNDKDNPVLHQAIKATRLKRDIIFHN